MKRLQIALRAARLTCQDIDKHELGGVHPLIRFFQYRNTWLYGRVVSVENVQQSSRAIRLLSWLADRQKRLSTSSWWCLARVLFALGASSRRYQDRCRHMSCQQCSPQASQETLNQRAYCPHCLSEIGTPLYHPFEIHPLSDMPLFKDKMEEGVHYIFIRDEKFHSRRGF